MLDKTLHWFFKVTYFMDYSTTIRRIYFVFTDQTTNL